MYKFRALGLLILTGCMAAFGAGKDGVPIHEVETNGFIKDWLVCGPFPNPSGADEAVARLGLGVDFLNDVGGETGCEPQEGMRVSRGGRDYAFEAIHSSIQKVRLRRVYDENEGVAYAYCLLHSKNAREAYVHVGSDDGLKLFVNGALVHEHKGGRPCEKSSDIIAVRLAKGPNQLLVKTAQAGGPWEFMVQVQERRPHIEALRELLPERTQVAVEQSGAMGEELALHAKTDLPVAGALDDLRVEWRLTDWSGNTLTRKRSILTEAITTNLSAEPGIYGIELELPDAEGRPVSLHSGCVLGTDPASEAAAFLREAVQTMLEPDDNTYVGWLQYLLWRAEDAGRADGYDQPRFHEEVGELREWLGRIEENPLPKTRGMFEWAYLSDVDHTGQPFTIYVPESYDPQRPIPLLLRLHAAGGTHMPTQRTPYDCILVRVLGRARCAGYAHLSEVDVLDALAYIQEHWNIDPDRVHLGGESMGGFGTFEVATRHPHLFASAFAISGGGPHVHVENLLHLPFFSSHSDDDWVVPIVLSRVPLQGAERAGARVTQREVTGFAHEVTDRDAHRLTAEWEQGQVRPDTVSRVRYTATDELARGAYWAEVVKWGPTSAPASFDVRCEADNTLRVDTKNVGILRVDLTTAPVIRSRDLSVVAKSGPAATVPSPLPDEVYLSWVNGRCTVATDGGKAPAVRRRFPSGPATLYRGEPLMVVWGTQGDPEMNAALRRAAERMRRSVHPGWLEETDPPVETMLCGALPAKPDTDVTEEDLRTHNLLLLGTAEHNAVVARMAEALPVAIDGEALRTDDGIRYGFKERAVVLVYHNPLAPPRLICWLASDAPGFYDVPTRKLGACDFTLMPVTGETVIAQRNFTSDWAWEAGYAESPLVPDALCAASAFAAFEADALRAGTESEFAAARLDGDATEARYATGTTRWMDVTAHAGGQRPGVFSLSGADLLQHSERLKAPVPDDNTQWRLFPDPASAAIDATRMYRIVVANPWEMAAYAKVVGQNPERTEVPQRTWADAIERHRNAE